MYARIGCLRVRGCSVDIQDGHARQCSVAMRRAARSVACEVVDEEHGLEPEREFVNMDDPPGPRSFANVARRVPLRPGDRGSSSS